MSEDLLQSFEQSVDDVDLEQFESLFGYKDAVQEKGFIPNKPHRFLRARVVDTLQDHVQFLHSLLMPNPKNLLANSQSNALSEDEQSLVSDLIDEYAAVVTRSRQVSLAGGTEDEKAFLDDAIATYKRTQDDFAAILQTVRNHWEDERNG
jgi:hypothetical protein